MKRCKTKYVGIGGINCYCCRMFKKSKTKKLNNRTERRKAKQDLQKEC